MHIAIPILNERDWVEDVLSGCSLGSRPYETLGRVARYFYAEGYKPKEIEHAIVGFLKRCDQSISIVKWQSAIDSVVANAGKRPLVELVGISITRREMERIGTLETRTLQRLMFTLLCVAKYRNAVNGNGASWVSCDEKEIFRMANIKITNKRQSLMINDLWSKGFIGYSKIVDNININVKIVDDDSPEAVFVSSFEDVGNQYMMAVGENYFSCECCGRIIRRTSNAQRYCRKCSVEMHKQKASSRYESFKN